MFPKPSEFFLFGGANMVLKIKFYVRLCSSIQSNETLWKSINSSSDKIVDQSEATEHRFIECWRGIKFSGKTIAIKMEFFNCFVEMNDNHRYADFLQSYLLEP